MREWKKYRPRTFIGSLERECPLEITNTATLLKQVLENSNPKRAVRFREDTGQVTNPGLAKIIKKETE